jgi:DNA-binding LacI/PurR family transcriptional regulator
MPLFSAIAGGITAIQQPTDKIAEQLFRMLSVHETKRPVTSGARQIALECQIVLRSSTSQLGVANDKKKMENTHGKS